LRLLLLLGNCLLLLFAFFSSGLLGITVFGLLFLQLLLLLLGELLLTLLLLLKVITDFLEKLGLGDWLIRLRKCGGDLEHLTGTFTVTGSDNRRVNVQETSLLEELVSGV